MRYMFLIYGDPEQPDAPELMAKYGEFTQCVAERGVLRAGNQLHRAPSAKTVSVRGGNTIATDGPYAETKEQIGGYYIIDCRDMEEAVQVAASIPNAADGYVEIRPIVGD